MPIKVDPCYFGDNKNQMKKKTHTIGSLRRYDDYTFACVSKYPKKHK